MTPQRRVLGEDGQEGQLIQLTVRDEGDFSLLLVEIRQDGRVRIAAETACWPGDREELSELLFHGERLGEGYLPTDVESPTDPLFFGITPGDPQVRPRHPCTDRDTRSLAPSATRSGARHPCPLGCAHGTT